MGKILILLDYNVFIDVITTLVLLLYEPTMEYFYGATLGKMALRLKVVTHGLQKITLKQAIARNIFNISHQIATMLISCAVLDSEMLNVNLGGAIIPGYVITIHDTIYSAFILLGVVVYTFNSKHQALHDIMAKTYVIQT